VINGFIVVKLRVGAFIATLGTATILEAVITIVSGDVQPLTPVTKSWTDLTQGSVLGFQVVFFELIVLAIIVWWVLDHTPAGRYLFAVGGNPEAAGLAGIRVGRWTWTSLIAAAGIAGVAGVLYSSQTGPSLTFGQELLLPAYAGVFLGSTQLYPGRFNVWGTMLAVFVIATGVDGMQLVTGVQWLNEMFNGVALIATVAFAASRQNKGPRRSRRWKVPNPEVDDVIDDLVEPDKAALNGEARAATQRISD
jgi:ribose transport system permease protein